MQMKIGAAGLLLLALVFVVGPVQTAEAQCALCRTALESSPEGQAMAAGFNQAILFLLAAPFLVVGSGILVFWRAARRGRSQATLSERQVARTT